MSNVAIRCQGLSKLYRIGKRERYKTLSGLLSGTLYAAGRRLRSARWDCAAGPVNGENDLWALKDVSWEVERGDVVGVIGRNGAGKTTLLKVLSRITEPTRGRAEVRGRIGSLLEVGTGFHPELSGRENIFLNGSILGMKRNEIVRRFDEIANFAEIERLLDTPVKHYSSGMYVRLAFSVAAHLEPDTLIVDEVLAVGDQKFQKKCLGKLADVAGEGRTVIVVSHQMLQIRKLCSKALWLESGKVRSFGETADVVAAYETMLNEPVATDAGGAGCFLAWRMNERGHSIDDGREPCSIALRIQVPEPVSRGHLGLALLNEAGLVVAGWSFDELALSSGTHELVLKLPMLPLRPGVYTITCSLFNEGNNLTGGHLLDTWSATPPLVVRSVPLSHSQDQWAGILNIRAELEHARLSAVSASQD